MREPEAPPGGARDPAGADPGCASGQNHSVPRPGRPPGGGRGVSGIVGVTGTGASGGEGTTSSLAHPTASPDEGFSCTDG
ncbi:hypothetical protein GCM10009660_49100 [Catellatospora bangladeshensis]